jgi:Methylamine utilisation protein MauE
MIDPLVVWIALACTATLFAHAAVAKAMDLALFEQYLAALGVPHALLGIASRAVPSAEALAALLLFTPWRSAGAALAVTLLLLYGAVMALHVARGRTPDCGCGGEPLPVSWALVARNGAMAAVAAVAAAPMAARAMSAGDFFVVAAALLLATLLYAALHQVLRHRAVRSSHALFRRT